jgi:hypothetical protein
MLLKRATVRNVLRTLTLKEINAFEVEGDFKPKARQALKEILEKRLEDEIAEYLGLSRYEHAADRPGLSNGSRLGSGLAIKTLPTCFWLRLGVRSCFLLSRPA